MLHQRFVILSRHGGATGREADLSASAAVSAVVALPHGLPRSLVFGVLAVFIVGWRSREERGVKGRSGSLVHGQQRGPRKITLIM
jgi:hypothetical protein